MLCVHDAILKESKDGLITTTNSATCKVRHGTERAMADDELNGTHKGVQNCINKFG